MTKLCLKCKKRLPIENFYLVRRRAAGRAYRVSPCKVCSRAASKQARIADPERYRNYAKKWRKLNPEKHLKVCAERNRRIKEKVFSQYGGCCACCGEKELVFLAIDHINGGGKAHMDKVGRGAAFWYWLRRNRYPKGFRVLCHNCNWAVAFGRICPHELKEESGL